MKKLSLLVLLVALLSACSSPSDYKISGKFDSSWDGQKVVLFALSATDGLIGIDSTVIKGSEFDLSGTADSLGWYILYFQKGNEPPFMKDFYMGGKLECSYKDGRIVYKGSDINNKYQAFEDKYVMLSKEIVALNQQQQANPNDAALTSAFNKAYEKFNADFALFTKTTILENMDNPLGYHIFEAAVPSLPNEVLVELVAKGNADFLQKPLVKMVVEQLEMSKKVSEGSKCPDLTLSKPDSKKVALSEYVGKGNYVLLDFWASWCAPCMQELPNLKAAYFKYHSKGFEIVGISLDEDAIAWRTTVVKNKMNWPQLSDLAGWKSQAVSVFSFSAIPHTILVDPNGIIVAKGLRGEALMNKLKEIYK